MERKNMHQTIGDESGQCLCVKDDVEISLASEE
jgi:hypothetical protein